MNELRVGAPVVVAGVTLIPVERLRFVSQARQQASWFQARKEVFALVICDAHGPHAVGADGQSLSIDQLIEMAPELHAALSVAINMHDSLQA